MSRRYVSCFAAYFVQPDGRDGELLQGASQAIDLDCAERGRRVAVRYNGFESFVPAMALPRIAWDRDRPGKQAAHQADSEFDAVARQHEDGPPGHPQLRQPGRHT